MSTRRLAVPLALGLVACQQSPTPVAARSLEQSRDVVFTCLAAQPSDGSSPGHPVEDCSSTLAVDQYDYTTVPLHVFGLVTQPVRGELALVDVTGQGVFDTDPSTPGFNFQPVGAQPVDVVVTPGGTAAFVATAEPNRPAIYALPTARLRTRAADVRAWPSCALPGAPGAMRVMIDAPADHADPTTVRATCDGPRGVPAKASDPAIDLSRETRTPGTRKLVVTIPSLGEIDVIDAQQLLSREGGSYDACPIERRIPLAADLAGGPSVQPAADGGADASCLVPSPTVTPSSPHPAGVAVDSGRLFVADDAAPVVHVLAGGPCELAETAPLLPSSLADPRKVVTSRDVAVSPLTSDGAQFAYVVDATDGSVMAFDVGPTSTSRSPIVHDDPAHDPFEPRDRLTLGSPVRTIAFVQRDVPYLDANGVGRYGVQCDPDPSSTDAAAISYRTSSDYTTGAGPRNLRGTFAFAALENGQVVVIDVDDYDAKCRRPIDDASEEGCGGTSASYSSSGTATTSQELSCRVVERHRLRSGRYYTHSDVAGQAAPSMQTFPRLTDKSGSDLPISDATNPLLLGPRGGEPYAWVGGTLPSSTATDGGAPAITSDPKATPTNRWVSFDLHDPRSHVEQDWAITYEGQLPGFGGHVARLQCVNPAQTPVACDPQTLQLWDPSAVFCDRGVQPSGSDVVTLTDDFLDDADPYWASVASTCSPVSCRTTFGTPDLPTSARDLVIDEAYQDHLVLAQTDVRDATDTSRKLPIACCFPQLVGYQIRGKSQWIVTGSVTGFTHAMVADPATLACVPACDATGTALRTGRVRELARTDAVPTLDDGRGFHSAQLRFAVWSGTDASKPSQRDSAFTFHESGSFSPLVVGLASSSAVAPQSVTFLPTFGELAFADGASQGVVFLGTTTLTVTRQFY